MVLYFFISLALAQDVNSVEKWPLGKIIERATEYAPEIKALAKDVERAENLAGQAGKWDNPEASVSYGPMTQSGLSGTSLDVSVMQSIPLFWQKSAAANVEEQNLVTVEQESTKKLLIINHEVVKLSYKLAAIDEQLKHLAHRKNKINLIAEFLNSRPFASPSQALEKSLILNRFREIEEKFIDASLEREKIWKHLNTYLDLKIQMTPDISWSQKPKLPSKETLFGFFQKLNPDILRQESLVVTADLEATKAGKKAFPDIRIGGGYNQQTADLPQKVYAGTIQFSLPIFDRGGYAKSAALAQKEAETYRLEHKKRELKAEFEEAWITLQKNKNRIELYPPSLITQLEAQVNRAELNWKKGLVQATAFLELENQVHEHEDRVFDSQVIYIESLSDIEFLSGLKFTAEVH